MSIRPATACAVVAAICLVGVPGVGAQGLGRLGGAADAATQARAQAQTQQRVQSQVQQRIQTQAQLQVRARVEARLQTRVQAQTDRAIRLAERASAAIERQAAAARQDVRARANGARRAEIGIGADISLEAQAAGRPANAGLSSNAALRAGANAQAASRSDANDRAALDEIFGEFNPFTPHRRAAEVGAASGETSGSSLLASDYQQTADAPGGSVPESRPENESAKNESQSNPQLRGFDLGSQVGLQGRVDVAIRQRGAQISRLRDRALQTSDIGLMARADEMEAKLVAFEEMHRARLQEQQSRVRTAAGSRTEAQPAATADAGAGLSGEASATGVTTR